MKHLNTGYRWSVLIRSEKRSATEEECSAAFRGVAFRGVGRDSGFTHRVLILRVESHGWSSAELGDLPSKTWYAFSGDRDPFDFSISRSWSHEMPWSHSLIVKKWTRISWIPPKDLVGYFFLYCFNRCFNESKVMKQKVTSYINRIFCRHTKIWLVVWNIWIIFPFHIWDVILPIDFHTFQDGWNHQPAIYDNFN